MFALFSKFFLSILLLVTTQFSLSTAQEIQKSPETGTIIVTYQTDPSGNRLDRVRFWLINEHHQRTLFPKQNDFVSNPHNPNERTVVIADLPVGRYRIDFLVPNCDCLFEETPPRHIALKGGAIVKVEQTIHLHNNTQTSTSNDSVALNGIIPTKSNSLAPTDRQYPSDRKSVV